MKHSKIYYWLIFLLVGAFLCSCDDKVDNNGTTVYSTDGHKSYSLSQPNFSTIIIDSCEYVIGYHLLAHKGNCKFCAERRKKER